MNSPNLQNAAQLASVASSRDAISEAGTLIELGSNHLASLESAAILEQQVEQVLANSVDVIWPEVSQDGIEQISQSLESQQSINTIDIVSERGSEQLPLHNLASSFSLLEGYRDELLGWQVAQTGADVLPYRANSRQVEAVPVSVRAIVAPSSKLRQEFEDLTLNGYKVETSKNSGASGGKQISLKGNKSQQGSASGTFKGTSGTYQVKLGYFDENDGQSKASLTVGGQTANLVFGKDLSGYRATAATKTDRVVIEAVQLEKGDTFTLNSRADRGEHARFDYIEFLSVEAKSNGNERAKPVSIVRPEAVKSEAIKTIPAFPGAEGFGSQTTHGRGGKIIEVTNLNDSGAGSLREALETRGRRIIVFKVGGVIELKSKLNVFEPYAMIAGQTAPGDGITLKGSALNIATHDIVVRYLRTRPGDGDGEEPEDRDGIQVYPYAAYNRGLPGKAYNIVFDHVSASWGIDENVSFYGSLKPDKNIEVRDITMQWSIISEGLNESRQPNRHPKGAHSNGLLVGGGANRISLHHNLLAHNKERNPLFKTGTNADLVNNVLYNAPGGIAMVDEDNGYNHPYPTQLNIVGNIAIEGPQTKDNGYIFTLDNKFLTKPGQFYLQGNISTSRTSNSQDEWSGANLVNIAQQSYRVGKPALNAPSVTTSSAEQAYIDVLAKAGAIFPVRDSVDARIVAEVKARTGSFIDSPSQVGGFPNYRSGRAYIDTDRDGMSDRWERRWRFDRNNASDGNGDTDGDGYTNVEEFLNRSNPLTKD